MNPYSAQVKPKYFQVTPFTYLSPFYDNFYYKFKIEVYLFKLEIQFSKMTSLITIISKII